MPVGFSEISVFVYLVDPDLHPSLWIRILEDFLSPKHWYKKKYVLLRFYLLVLELELELGLQ